MKAILRTSLAVTAANLFVAVIVPLLVARVTHVITCVSCKCCTAARPVSYVIPQRVRQLVSASQIDLHPTVMMTASAH